MSNKGAVVRRSLIASVVAVVAAFAGSWIDPYGSIDATGGGQPILHQAQIDPATLGLLRRACLDCHSEQTVWPWYRHVAPASWLLARDVQQARLHMNLSRWQEYSADEQILLLGAIGSAVRNGRMPVERYVLLHREARLTDAERQQIYRWARKERNRLRGR